MAAIRKRGSTYTITASLGYREDGSHIRKHTMFVPPPDVTPGKAEKLAKQYAAIWENKIKGYVSLDENKTFRELADWYYENIAPTVLKDTVKIGNQATIEKYIMPVIGREKLKNITPQMLDTLLANLARNGRIKQLYKLVDTGVIPHKKQTEISKKTGITRHTIWRLSAGHCVGLENAKKFTDGLGLPFKDTFVPMWESMELTSGTVKRIRQCISPIFSAAVRKEIMQRNPVTNTETLRRKPPVESFLDEEHAVSLLNALENHNNLQFKVMITTLLFTGMRRGELCGLKWSCVNLDSGIIHIREALVYNRRSVERGIAAYSLETPKTPSSIRYIKIPSSLIELFKKLKEEQEQRRAVLGDSWVDRGMVFCKANGEYFSLDYINVQFKELAKKIGLPDNVHIHTLRHTTASLLINANIPTRVISDQLGHYSTGITEDLYAHVFASSKVKAMQALEMSLLKK